MSFISVDTIGLLPLLDSSSYVDAYANCCCCNIPSNPIVAVIIIARPIPNICIILFIWYT